MKKSILIGYFFIAIIAGITLGIIVHVFNDTSMEQGMIDEVENVNKIAKRNETNIIVTSSKEIKTSPNAYLIFEIQQNTLYSYVCINFYFSIFIYNNRDFTHFISSIDLYIFFF